MRHADEQITTLKPELQRKMAMMALAGWTFAYRTIGGAKSAPGLNPGTAIWEIRAPNGQCFVWLTLSVGIGDAWRRFQPEEQANG